MEKVKNIFACQQKFIDNVVILLCSILLFVFFACQANLEDNPSRDKEIAFNLSDYGECDPDLLIGEWDIMKFAYTSDGKKITDIEVISLYSATLTIPFAPTSKESQEDDYWKLKLSNTFYYSCSLSGNLLKLDDRNDGRAVFGLLPPAIEYEIQNALEKAYSYVIKDKELIIHFEGEKDKNLLILRRRPNHNLISSNLLKDGIADRQQLIGEWDCVKFAYTDDGLLMMDVSFVTKGRIKITERIDEFYNGFFTTKIKHLNLYLFHANTSYYIASNTMYNNDAVSPDEFIFFSKNGHTFDENPPPQEEIDINHVFLHSNSFVIRGDELIIHFTRGENKNLLILKKRTSTHELISTNLIKMGSAELQLLYGVWNCSKFAYTTDGNSITKIKNINNTDQWKGRRVRIPNASSLFLLTTDIQMTPPRAVFEMEYNCLISGNLFQLSSLIEYALLFLPPGEIDVAFALANAYSFVIKKDELIIYFAGTDERNLLLLNKY